MREQQKAGIPFMFEDKKLFKCHVRLTQLAYNAAKDSAVTNRRHLQDELGLRIERSLEQSGYVVKGNRDELQGEMGRERAKQGKTGQLNFEAPGPIRAREGAEGRKRAIV